MSIIQLSTIGYTDLYDAEICMHENGIQEYRHMCLPELSETRVYHKIMHQVSQSEGGAVRFVHRRQAVVQSLSNIHLQSWTSVGLGSIKGGDQPVC